MRGRKKIEMLSRLKMEDQTAQALAESNSPGSSNKLLAMIFVRQGEMLQQLQEIQGNTWLR